MLYGRLLDNNGHSCESLADLSYPVVLLQGGESRGDRFIESLRGDLYGVLNVSNVLDRNCARSENHTREGSIFAFCSPLLPVCWAARFPYGRAIRVDVAKDGPLIATKAFLYSAALSMANTLDTK